MKLPRARHLSRFADLPADRRRELLLASCLIPALALGLRVYGFGRCYRWVERTGPLRNGAATTASELSRLVSTAARFGIWPGNCLSRSLALCLLLRRHELEGHLRIGVRREGGQLEAHAWVESGGVPLNDASDVARRFPPFGRLDQLPAATFV
jgi:hypothetical protein